MPASLKAIWSRGSCGMLARLARPASAPGARRPTTAMTAPMKDASIGRRRSKAVTVATSRPPGRRTRKISLAARGRSGICSSTRLATAQSKARSGTLAMACTSPRRNRTGRSAGVRACASSTHSGLESMPTTIPSGPTTRAAARVAPPEPQPRSSTRSPATTGAQAIGLS